VGESLELVRLEPDVIVNDVIVCRTNCALKTVVRLEEEIKICASCPLVSHSVDLVQRHAHRKQR